MSGPKKTGNGARKSQKGNGSSGLSAPVSISNIATKANVRDAIGGIEVETYGGWMPAVYLDEIRDRVLQDTNAQGAYDHPPARGNAPLDVTAFHADQQTWGEAKEHRPPILFEYKKNGRQDPNYEVGIWMDIGRVVLGPDGVPIRDFRNIPKLCSSQMEGFRMEAISRLDSRISISDFRARMMRDGLPGANAISMRKTRFRNRCRCLAWDKRAGTDFYEEQLSDEMTDDMINRNSTEELDDLTSAKTTKLQLETAGTAPARSGTRALADNVRALRLKTAKAKNQKKLDAEAMLEQENTEQQPGLLESLSNTNAPVVSATKRKRMTEGGLAESLHQYVDELFDEKRPNKKRRDHESPSFSPEVFNAKKRKRTTAEEVGSNDEEVDEVEGRTFKRSRHWNPLELLPDSSSFPTPRTSLPPAPRVHGAMNVDIPRHTRGAGQIQGVDLSDDSEQLARGVDYPRHERREAQPPGLDRALDDRNLLPFSVIEQDRVQNALSVTRHHYEFVTGLNAPETRRRENYFSQYGSLQLQFHGVWRDAGIQDPLPVLAGLNMWLPGSLRWNQSTDLLLSSYGANGRALLNGLENEIGGGLSELFNRNAPRVDLTQNWRDLGRTIQPQPNVDPPAAVEPFADFQPAATFGPSAAIDPSLSIGPSPVDQPLSGVNTSGTFDPFADLQPTADRNPFADLNSSGDRNTMAAFEPATTGRVQAKFTGALPNIAGRTTTVPAAGAPILGCAASSSSSPRYSDNLGPDQDFKSWLDEYLDPRTSTAPQPAVQQAAVQHPRYPEPEDSLFNDAALMNNRTIDEPPFARPQVPQADSPTPTASWGPDDTSALDDDDARLVAAIDNFLKADPDLWQS